MVRTETQDRHGKQEPSTQIHTCPVCLGPFEDTLFLSTPNARTCLFHSLETSEAEAHFCLIRLGVFVRSRLSAH